jgi:type II secretory pathway pseudopilin PulG
VKRYRTTLRTIGRRRAFSLVEGLVSIVVVSVLLVAALNTVGSAWHGQQNIGDRARARLLAEELLAEIVQADYNDPNQTPGFGPEISESGGSRAGFDDVDDYHGWQASPPQDKNGSAMTAYAGWGRRVAVHYVEPSSPSIISSTDQGAKRIVVTVTYNNVLMARLVGIRSGQPIPGSGDLEVLEL